ncbi:MAG: hypothetical protein ACRCST_08180 [Turicibacter sp.]
MAENRNKRPYRSGNNGYRPTRGNNQGSRKNSQMTQIPNPVAYRFMIQALIAACVMMGVLVTDKLQLQEGKMYENLKSSFLSTFPYGKINDYYNSLFGEGVFPLDINSTLPVFGTQELDEEATTAVMNTVDSIRNNVVLRDYLNGVIIQVEVGEPVLSLVPGIVQSKDINDDILNNIKISLADDSVLTVGFLENPKVSLYEHITVNQPLGVGTQLEGESMAYYYLALEKDGEYVDLDNLLTKLEQLEKLGQFGQ